MVASAEALVRALDEGKVDHAVHMLLLLLGEPLSSKQKRRLQCLEVAMAKAGKLVRSQRDVALVPGLAVDADTVLSYSQLQMFTLQSMAPQSTAYNIVKAVRFQSSPMNLAALNRACDALLTKHQVLRTVYTTNHSGEPRQRVMPLSFFRRDGIVQELGYEGGDLGEFIAAKTTVPFDLQSQAPIRFYAVHDACDPASWALVVVMHHIVTDPESSALFYSDLKTFYAKYSQHTITDDAFACDLATIQASTSQQVSYRDYAQWQHDRLASGILTLSLQYWIHQLSQSDIPPLELPYDRPPPSTATSGDRQGSTVVFQSTPQLEQAFTALCGSHGAGMFIGLLAVFHMTLSRLTNCDDIVIGAPTAGRSRDTLAQVMGYFVNTLPFRLQSNADATFSEFLQYVKTVVVDGLSHMEIPLQKMLEHVALGRQHAGPFQVMFAWEGDATKSHDEETVQLPHHTAKFDLMLSMRYARDAQGAKVIEGTLEYPVDVFDCATIERFTGYMLELATQVTTYPTQKKLSEIQMLPAIEQDRLLSEWGMPPAVTEPEDHSGGFLDECIYSQVATTPGNTALRFEGVEWSYQDLWRHSSQISRAMQRDHCMNGVRVGLFIDRGLENIAAIVGVLQSRAVFIPLDPEFPADRIQYMLEDSHAEVIITQRHLLTKLELFLHKIDARVIVCEDVFAEPFTIDTSSIHSRSTGGDPAQSPAYILYTSGSTGKPKGVVVTHANILTTLQWSVREYAVSTDDVFLQSTSSTLDGSLTQLFTPLIAGASALVTKKNGLHDLAYIAALLATHRITYCVFVPSYFSMLLDYMGDSFPSSVKYVVLAGEAFSTALATKFYQKYARFSTATQAYECATCLVNEYGPTEASVTSTFFRFPCEMAMAQCSAMAAQQQSVPIGGAIDDHFLLVLDKHKRLVPVNVPGELYVGGRGVAQCYWQRPELTGKSFHHPELAWIHTHATLRWYKTGDLVKWLPSGQLVFLGRTDSQVKLRGMRIELQEVRNVILQSPQVKDAEVLVVTQRLVAYVVATDPRACARSLMAQLREYAQRRLPVHMVPHEICLVDQWPRTPNGKLDLKALALWKPPALPSTQDASDECNQASHSGEDQETGVVVDILKQAWREVLQLEDEAALLRASFFELGGNSLSAIRVISLVKPLGVCLKLESFFRCKSLLEMAAGCASTMAGASQKTVMVPLNWKPSNGTDTPLFLVHCADGTVWKMMELARRLPVAVYGLQAVHGGAVESVEELAALYWQEIKAVQRSGTYRIGGFSFGCRVAHAIAEIGMKEGATFAPLTLLDGPPFCRAAEPQSGEDEDNMMNVTEYVARALGWKTSPQQPQDGAGKQDGSDSRGDPERELFDQLVSNYAKHCELDRLYRPSTQAKMNARLYKTANWDVDVEGYRESGLEIEVVPVDGEHLTMLRTPHVESVARAVEMHLQ